MPPPSIKNFLKLLEMSGIVDQDSLKPVLAKIKQKHQEAGRKSITSEVLADDLVDSGLITRWHRDKLLSGKYRGFQLGKYKLLGHLGSGGMSKVYLAQHRISGQLRAIKVLPRQKVTDKSYLDRFYLEARIAASLNHPNVVRIYDICNEANMHYMVMEYVKGRDLAQVVAQEGPLTFEKAARYTLQAAEGLKHAHERELVHRDIKPANLLLTEKQDIKILDLGLALVNQDDSKSLTVLYNEKVMGTADYLSPEQAVNSHKVDGRADIYSLGCTLYFFLAAYPPFPEGTLAQRIAKHQSETPTSLHEIRDECPETLVKICEKMMRKQADDRFQTCDQLQAALRKFLKGSDYSDSVIIKSEAVPPRPSPDPEPKSVPSATPVAGAAPAKPLKNLQVRKRKKAMPQWMLLLIIASMFLVLVAVLAITASLIR